MYVKRLIYGEKLMHIRTRGRAGKAGAMAATTAFAVTASVMAGGLVSPAQATTRTTPSKAPAQASQLRGEWKSLTDRQPVDGDDGGVSGYAHRYWSGDADDTWAEVNFRALGEKWGVANSTGTTAYFFAWVDNKIYFQWKLKPNERKTWSRGFREGLPVKIQVCVNSRGCATQDNLRT
ncbi:hypothetical protein E1287_04140 [Actinomadura sp. KC06]|uniref:hypothetical protein n=1 Tax=Actinomadura sp. KC06 TaxID=2530369 RepID=UPI0010526E7B|nr:hypothetical protein [Actinomadura sp. KC06]TDD39008.1 hypothetical protein E1287_04140 [Actinomadura sp. KC06]